MTFFPRLSVLFFALFCLVFTSCEKEWIRPSGELSREDYDIQDYDQIEIAGGIEADITFSDSNHGIEIEADDNILDFIEVKRTGSTLVIKLENNVCVKGSATMRAHITTDPLTNFKALGDSRINFNNKLITTDFTVSLSGDSELRGSVECKRADLDAMGDSRIALASCLVDEEFACDLSGDSEFVGLVEATEIDIQASGDSKFKIEDRLLAEEIEAELSGDSTMEGAMEISRADMKGTGGSEFELSGYADDLELDLSGDSRLNDYDLIVNTLDAKLIGDSEAYITVNEDIRINASGDSSLYYKGNATISQETLVGGSKVKDMN